MMKKTVSLLLVLTLALGLTVPSFAAGQTYDDVPESYWGYKDIEAVSEAGYMNGIGGGQFAPEMKVSVAQFLTLLGRLVFPEVKVGENDSLIWTRPQNNAELLTINQKLEGKPLPAFGILEPIPFQIICR